MAFIPPAKPGTEFSSPSRGERLQRFMADQGIASRRACEELIRAGRVSVNGIKVTALPVFVDTARDHVEIDGRGLEKHEPSARRRHEYVLLNKPARTLAVSQDEPGLDRATVMDLVKHHSGKRLFPVGRLDYETTGLLLLTDDGELTNRLTHPKFNVSKVYEVVVKGPLSGGDLDALRKGLRKFEKQATRREQGAAPAVVTPVEIELIAKDADKTLLRITIRESRNREIRQMIAAAGLVVRKVERVAVGPLSLKGVRLGAWRDLEPSEVKALYRASGPETATNPARLARSPVQSVRPIGSFKLGSRGRDSEPLAQAAVPGRPAPRSRKTEPTSVKPAPKSAPRPSKPPQSANSGPATFDAPVRKGPRVIAPRQY